MRPTRLMIGLQFVAALVFFLGLLQWLSGNWRWVEGWIFGVWWVVLAAVTLSWFHYRDPALYAERFGMPGIGDQSHYELAIFAGIKVGFLAWLVVPRLDLRFGWTPRLPLWCAVCSGILLLAGSFFMFRGLTDNTFASQLVRIQRERGQHVVDTGVYGFVRHPMYLGGILTFVGGGLLLGSISGTLLGLALAGLMVVRIFGEEKLLARDLVGYKEYTQKVRYRLLPHVW